MIQPNFCCIFPHSSLSIATDPRINFSTKIEDIRLANKNNFVPQQVIGYKIQIINNTSMSNKLTIIPLIFSNCFHQHVQTFPIYTAQKMKFSIKDFFSKYDQIHRKLRIWSHLLKKFLMENFIFLCSDTALISFSFYYHVVHSTIQQSDNLA